MKLIIIILLSSERPLSVAELREQLEKFERQLALIPRLVVQDKLQELMEESKEARAQLDTDSNQRLNELEKSRVSRGSIGDTALLEQCIKNRACFAF